MKLCGQESSVYGIFHEAVEVGGGGVRVCYLIG